MWKTAQDYQAFVADRMRQNNAEHVRRQANDERAALVDCAAGGLRAMRAQAPDLLARFDYDPDAFAQAAAGWFLAQRRR